MLNRNVVRAILVYAVFVAMAFVFYVIVDHRVRSSPRPADVVIDLNSPLNDLWDNPPLVTLEDDVHPSG